VDGAAGRAPDTVEQFGIEIGSAMGWPRMAGRVFATLMLHDGPLSMKELQKALGASAGAISEMTRLLDANGVVTRVKIPGTRQTGYAYRDDAWMGCLEHQLAIATQLLGLAESSSRTPEAQAAHTAWRFADMRAYYTLVRGMYIEAEREFAARAVPPAEPA
jgi:DNA-binding Lrp family transcriptional regulator